MCTLSYTKCFAKYGAKLANPRWAVSAQADDGSIVISCWKDYFDDSGCLYTDTFSRWEKNAAGNNLLRKHINLAKTQNLPIRLVLTTAQNNLPPGADWDATKIPKTFSICPEFVGKVVSFDGDEFIIKFSKSGN